MRNGVTASVGVGDRAAGVGKVDVDATPELIIREVASDDPAAVFAACAGLHAETITDGFLTSLGTGVLTEFYRSIAALPQSFLLVAERRGEVVGLIAGSIDTGRWTKAFLAKRAWRLAPYAPRVVARKSFFRKVRETLSYSEKVSAPDLPNAEIMNFCIAPGHQGQGIGRALFDALNAAFADRDISSIRIVTGGAQRRAQAFYTACGAEPVGETEVHVGTQSLIFVHTIGAFPAPIGRTTDAPDGCGERKGGSDG